MSRTEAGGAGGPLAVLTQDGRLVARAVRRADGPVARFFGLMGRTRLAEGEGLWLEPSSGIHMFFMRIPIDCAFVDRGGRVLRIAHRLRPWRVGWWLIVPGSRATLEVAAGALAASGVRVGDRLSLVAQPAEAGAAPPAPQLTAIPAAGPLFDPRVPGGPS